MKIAATRQEITTSKNIKNNFPAYRRNFGVSQMMSGNAYMIFYLASYHVIFQVLTVYL